MGLLDMWPVILVAAQVLLYFVVSVFLTLQYFKEVRLDTVVLRRETWVPWAGAVNPGWLFGVRVCGFCYLLGLLIQVCWIRRDWTEIYNFYTEWTLTLLIIYFGLAIYISSTEMIDNNKKKQGAAFLESERCKIQAPLLEKYMGDEEQNEEKKLDPGSISVHLQAREGTLGYILQCLFQIAAPAVILTDGVYWAFLFPNYPEDYPLTASEWNLHVVNAIFLGAELVLNSMKFPGFRVAYFFFFSCIYTFVQWGLVYFLHKPWPYPFMGVTSDLSPVWYLVVALLHVTAYVIATCANIAKLYLQKYSTSSQNLNTLDEVLIVTS